MSTTETTEDTMSNGRHHAELCNINGESWKFGAVEALDNYAAWESTLLIGGALYYIKDGWAAANAMFGISPVNPSESLMAI